MDNDYNKSKTDMTSDYNEAKLQIFRLHNKWEDCNKFSASGNLHSWKWALDVIWRELSYDAKRLDKKKYFDKNEELKNNIAQAENADQLYDALNEREIFLRDLQEESGKGGKYGDPSAYDFE